MKTMRRMGWTIRIRWRMWRGQPELRRANFWAKLAALAVSVLAAWALWPIRERQTSQLGTTQRVESMETQATNNEKRRARTTTSTVETKVTRDDGAVAALVSESGLLVLARIALVGGSAFLAGFITQRVLVADFAIEAGSLKIRSISGERVEGSVTRIQAGVPKP